MIDMNGSAPDTASGHATAGDSGSPNAMSGHGGDNQQQRVDTAQYREVSPQADSQPDRYEELRNNFNQKITELGQSKSQLEQKLQSLEQAQRQREEALAKALGYGPQEQTQPDVLSQLVDNPQWLEQRIQEIAQQQVAPLQQTLEMKDVQAYAANQAVEKQEIFSELSNQVGKDMAEKIMSDINVSHLVPPEILQMNQRLQNDTLLSPQEKQQMAQKVEMETWKALQRAGGYRELVNSALGKTLRSDLPGFIQSAARTFQQNQYSQNRTNSFGGYTGGAGSQSSSGGTSTIQSESVYR